MHVSRPARGERLRPSRLPAARLRTMMTTAEAAVARESGTAPSAPAPRAPAALARAVPSATGARADLRAAPADPGAEIAAAKGAERETEAANQTRKEKTVSERKEIGRDGNAAGPGLARVDATEGETDRGVRTRTGAAHATHETRARADAMTDVMTGTAGERARAAAFVAPQGVKNYFIKASLCTSNLPLCLRFESLVLQGGGIAAHVK